MSTFSLVFPPRPRSAYSYELCFYLFQLLSYTQMNVEGLISYEVYSDWTFWKFSGPLKIFMHGSGSHYLLCCLLALYWCWHLFLTFLFLIAKGFHLFCFHSAYNSSLPSYHSSFLLPNSLESLLSKALLFTLYEELVFYMCVVLFSC